MERAERRPQGLLIRPKIGRISRSDDEGMEARAGWTYGADLAPTPL